MSYSECDYVVGSATGSDYGTLSAAVVDMYFGGDSTTQYNISNPSGSTMRYTYNGTGTAPSAFNASTVLINGSKLFINGQNFNAANNGYFVLTATTSTSFDVTNPNGVVENSKSLGNGWMNAVKRFAVTSDFTEVNNIDMPTGTPIRFLNDPRITLNGYSWNQSHNDTQLYGVVTLTGTGPTGSRCNLVYDTASNSRWEHATIYLIPTGTPSANELIPFWVYGTDCAYNIVIRNWSTSYNGSVYAVAVGGNSSIFHINLDTLSNTSSGTSAAIAGLFVNGKYNAFHVSIYGVTTPNHGSNGTGIQVNTGGDYNSFFGAARGCSKSNYWANGGSGDSTGGLAS